MFYIKENINENVEIRVDIDYDNVYCRCPRCGKEVKVDLNEFFGDKEFDLYETRLYCDDCARKVRCDA